MSSYCEKVNVVDSGRMRPLALGNLQFLALLERSGIFRRFIDVLTREYCGLKGSSGEQTLIASLLTVCCIAYDLNESSVSVYSNGSINGFWRAMGRSQANFSMLNPTSGLNISLLTGGRTATGFERCHITRPTRSISSRTTTDRRALETRLKLMEAKELGCVELEVQCVPTFIRGLSVFKDYVSMMTSICGYEQGQLLRGPRSSICTLTVPCEDVETRQPVDICMTHGARTNSRCVILPTRLGFPMSVPLHSPR